MYSDHEYVRKRNKLIRVAEKTTTAKLGALPDLDEWDRVFINEMDRLSVENELQSVRYHAPRGGL